MDKAERDAANEVLLERVRTESKIKVYSYDGWKHLGRQIKKGEKQSPFATSAGDFARGFHEDQTRELKRAGKEKPEPMPELKMITTEREDQLEVEMAALEKVLADFQLAVDALNAKCVKLEQEKKALESALATRDGEIKELEDLAIARKQEIADALGRA